MWRKCKFCGKEFYSDIRGDFFCTPSCEKKYRQEYYWTLKRKNRDKIAEWQHKSYLKRKAERLKNENHSE